MFSGRATAIVLTEIRKNLRYNFIVSIFDASFFGFGMGLASTVSVIPLFVNTLTTSTALIGLIASIHLIGWRLPQLLVSKHLTQLRRYRPLTILFSTQERWPYLGLAIVALLI